MLDFTIALVNGVCLFAAASVSLLHENFASGDLQLRLSDAKVLCQYANPLMFHSQQHPLDPQYKSYTLGCHRFL